MCVAVVLVYSIDTVVRVSYRILGWGGGGGGGGGGLVLIIDLHANFHSDSALYPDSGFQSDSLSQGGTDSGLYPHSCLHPESGFQPF